MATTHTGPFRKAWVDPLPTGSRIQEKAFDDLKKGDIFALEEPNGDAVEGIWLALDDAKDGVIHCEPSEWRLTTQEKANGNQGN